MANEKNMSFYLFCCVLCIFYAYTYVLLFIRNAVKLCTVPVANLLYSRSLISQTAFVQSFLIFFHKSNRCWCYICMNYISKWFRNICGKFRTILKNSKKFGTIQEISGKFRGKTGKTRKFSFLKVFWLVPFLNNLMVFELLTSPFLTISMLLTSTKNRSL